MNNNEREAFGRGYEAVPALSTDDLHTRLMRRCLLTCLVNGWVPTEEDLLRLVDLKEVYDRGGRGKRRDPRLEFARHLYRTGGISDSLPHGESQPCDPPHTEREVDVFVRNTLGQIGSRTKTVERVGKGGI